MTPVHGRAPQGSSGALRLVEARTVSPYSVDIRAYVQEITEHCPYLAPSLRLGQTGWTVYQAATPADPLRLEASIFHAGVQAAERLRPLIQRPNGTLLCENVVVLGESSDDMLDWPHWALKHLYGPVGIMAGKFHKGEQRHDGQGRGIPLPPVSFLAVRAAVRTRDPRFLASTPTLAQALADAADDGRDVFGAHHLSRNWKEVRAWAAQCLPVRLPPARPPLPPAAVPPRCG